MPQIAGKLAAKIVEAIQHDSRSLYAIARDAGISRKQLGLFMRGQSDMTLTIAAKLCDVLGLTLTDDRKAKSSRRPEAN